MMDNENRLHTAAAELIAVGARLSQIVTDIGLLFPDGFHYITGEYEIYVSLGQHSSKVSVSRRGR